MAVTAQGVTFSGTKASCPKENAKTPREVREHPEVLPSYTSTMPSMERKASMVWFRDLKYERGTPTWKNLISQKMKNRFRASILWLQYLDHRAFRGKMQWRNVSVLVFALPFYLELMKLPRFCFKQISSADLKCDLSYIGF